MFGIGPEQIAIEVHAVVGGSFALVEPSKDPNEAWWEIRMPDDRIWNVVDDDSIQAPRSHRGELTSPILQEADLPLLARVADALSLAGAVVDASCGTHIHIGVRAEVTGFVGLVDLMLEGEAALMESLKIHPQRLHHAKPLDSAFVVRFKAQRPTTIDDFWEQWYGDANWRRRRNSFDDERRYYGLNFHAYHIHQTIEFRYFNGTLDSGAITSHIQRCLDLVGRAGLSPAEAQ
jgi:hypothetical protein